MQDSQGSTFESFPRYSSYRSNSSNEAVYGSPINHGFTAPRRSDNQDRVLLSPFHTPTREERLYQGGFAAIPFSSSEETFYTPASPDDAPLDPWNLPADNYVSDDVYLTALPSLVDPAYPTLDRFPQPPRSLAPAFEEHPTLDGDGELTARPSHYRRQPSLPPPLTAFRFRTLPQMRSPRLRETAARIEDWADEDVEELDRFVRRMRETGVTMGNLVEVRREFLRHVVEGYAVVDKGESVGRKRARREVDDEEVRQ